MPTTYWLKFGNTPLGYNGKALKTEYTEPGTVVINGRTYRTIEAGGNIWLAEDYRGTVGSLVHYSDIADAPPYTGTASVAYDGEAEPILYSYGAYQALLANPPQGWRVPLASEWAAFVADPVGEANIPRNDATRLRYVAGAWTSPSASDSIWGFDYWTTSPNRQRTRANVVVGGEYNVSFYDNPYNLIPVRLVKDA